jgi:hypothetical protein
VATFVPGRLDTLELLQFGRQHGIPHPDKGACLPDELKQSGRRIGLVEVLQLTSKAFEALS